MKAIGRKVIINVKDKETESGLILEETKKPVLEGVVISIGENVTLVKEKQEVYYSPYDFDELDKDHHIIDQEDIWAIKSQ